MSLKDKRGVSIMIGYVILVVIAVSLSVLVFAFLRLYLPSERATCPSDVNLVISEASCTTTSVSLNIENRGLFTVPRAFIRIGEPGRLSKANLGSSDGNPFYFGAIIVGVPDEGIAPGNSTGEFTISHSLDSGEDYEIEVQPVMVIGNDLVVCESVARRTVTCE